MLIYTFSFIVLSAPFKKKYILSVFFSLSIIPILFVSLLNGKSYNILYSSYSPEGTYIFILFIFLSIILKSIYSANLTNATSSGLAAYNSLFPLSITGETLLHKIKHLKASYK